MGVLLLVGIESPTVDSGELIVLPMTVLATAGGAIAFAKTSLAARTLGAGMR